MSELAKRVVKVRYIPWIIKIKKKKKKWKEILKITWNAVCKMNCLKLFSERCETIPLKKQILYESEKNALLNSQSLFQQTTFRFFFLICPIKLPLTFRVNCLFRNGDNMLEMSMSIFWEIRKILTGRLLKLLRYGHRHLKKKASLGQRSSKGPLRKHAYSNTLKILPPKNEEKKIR